MLLFGLYTIVMGVVLHVALTLVLPMIGLAVKGHAWIRLVGFVPCRSGGYSVGAARSGYDRFFQ